MLLLLPIYQLERIVVLVRGHSLLEAGRGRRAHHLSILLLACLLLNVQFVLRCILLGIGADDGPVQRVFMLSAARKHLIFVFEMAWIQILAGLDT